MGVKAALILLLFASTVRAERMVGEWEPGAYMTYDGKTQRVYLVSGQNTVGLFAVRDKEIIFEGDPNSSAKVFYESLKPFLIEVMQNVCKEEKHGDN